MDELVKSIHEMQLADQQTASVHPQLLPVDGTVSLSQLLASQDSNQHGTSQANSMQHAGCSIIKQDIVEHEHILPKLQVMQTKDQPPAHVDVPASPTSSSSSSSSDDENEIMPPVVSISPHRKGPEVPVPPSQPRATDNAVGLLYDQSMEFHKGPVYPEHYEQPERIMQVYAGLEEEGLLARCWRLPPRPATSQELLLVHTQQHIDEVEAMWEDPACNNKTAKNSQQQPTQQQPSNSGSTDKSQSNTASQAATYIRKGADLYVCADTAAAARMATGCCVQAVQHVLCGDVSAALAIVRPPGHHAECARAQGFCFFNNCAVAARVALQHPDVRRVLILDWDVHHGNGIQEALWEDPDILYISIHRDPKNFYPFFAGFIDEVGEGAGKGFNINIPWTKRNMGDAEYAAAFKLVVEPVVRSFAPDLIIVAAGFDAAEGDPIGGCKLTPEGYAGMTRWLLHMMPNTSKLVMALEGGYNTRVTAACAAACVRVLLEEPITKHNISTSSDPDASSTGTSVPSTAQQQPTTNTTHSQSQQQPSQQEVSAAKVKEQSATVTHAQQGQSASQDSCGSHHTSSPATVNHCVTSTQTPVNQEHQADQPVIGMHTPPDRAQYLSQQTTSNQQQTETSSRIQTPTGSLHASGPLPDNDTFAGGRQASPAATAGKVQRETGGRDAQNHAVSTGTVQQQSSVKGSDKHNVTPAQTEGHVDQATDSITTVNEHSGSGKKTSNMATPKAKNGTAVESVPVSHAAGSPAGSSNSTRTPTSATGAHTKSTLSAHIAGCRAAAKQAESEASSQTQQQTANDSYVATSNHMPLWPVGDAIKNLRQVCELQGRYWPVLVNPPFNVRWAQLEQCLSKQAKASHGESREGRRQSSRLHKG